MREKKVNLLKTWKRVLTLFSSSSPFFFSLHQSFHSQWERVCFFWFSYVSTIRYPHFLWLYLLMMGISYIPTGIRALIGLIVRYISLVPLVFFHYSFVNCALKIHIKGVRISTHAISCNASSYTMFVIRWFLICFRNVTQLKGVKMVYV